MGRFKLNRLGAGAYVATIIRPEGEMVAKVEKDEGDRWKVKDEETGEVLRLPTFPTVHSHMREVAGHPGRRGTDDDEREPAAYPSVVAVTPTARDTIEGLVEEQETGEHLSDQYVVSVGRRRVRDVIERDGETFGHALISGEQKLVRLTDAAEGRWEVVNGS